VRNAGLTVGKGCGPVRRGLMVLLLAGECHIRTCSSGMCPAWTDDLTTPTQPQAAVLVANRPSTHMRIEMDAASRELVRQHGSLLSCGNCW
jgi:hypothetical protein